MPDPFAVLGLPDTATEHSVRQQWRALLLVCHPDAGGTVDEFIRLQDAFREALRMVQDRPCPRCRGLRYVEVAASGIRVKLTCPECACDA